MAAAAAAASSAATPIRVAPPLRDTRIYLPIHELHRCVTGDGLDVLLEVLWARAQPRQVEELLQQTGTHARVRKDLPFHAEKQPQPQPQSVHAKHLAPPADTEQLPAAAASRPAKRRKSAELPSAAEAAASADPVPGIRRKTRSWGEVSDTRRRSLRSLRSAASGTLERFGFGAASSGLVVPDAKKPKRAAGAASCSVPNDNQSSTLPWIRGHVPTDGFRELLVRSGVELRSSASAAEGPHEEWDIFRHVEHYESMQRNPRQYGIDFETRSLALYNQCMPVPAQSDTHCCRRLVTTLTQTAPGLGIGIGIGIDSTKAAVAKPTYLVVYMRGVIDAWSPESDTAVEFKNRLVQLFGHGHAARPHLWLREWIQVQGYMQLRNLPRAHLAETHWSSECVADLRVLELLRDEANWRAVVAPAMEAFAHVLYEVFYLMTSEDQLRYLQSADAQRQGWILQRMQVYRRRLATASAAAQSNINKDKKTA
jgi:hypothetical protein